MKNIKKPPQIYVVFIPLDLDNAWRFFKLSTNHIQWPAGEVVPPEDAHTLLKNKKIILCTTQENPLNQKAILKRAGIEIERIKEGRSNLLPGDIIISFDEMPILNKDFSSKDDLNFLFENNDENQEANEEILDVPSVLEIDDCLENYIIRKFIISIKNKV